MKVLARRKWSNPGPDPDIAALGGGGGGGAQETMSPWFHEHLAI